MAGLFVAAAIVGLVQFLRVSDRRLLLLATMFAFQSQALSREWYDVWRDVFQAGVCAAGLLLVLTLSRRPAHDSPPRAEAAAPVPDPAAPVPSQKD